MANRIHNASPLQSQGGLSSCRLTRGTFPARLTHKVNLTLGSNIEDSAATIAKLLGLLDLTGNVRVVGTSPLHEIPLERGARPIVIDILLYDSIERHDDILNIPHVAMQEREFVLRLLNSFSDDGDYSTVKSAALRAQ
ncbi:hypothetical protein B0O80DRAFT_425713 [Mortierella sp. GBAus27b]|nr:hypothetical protein B0O80DRAFT_425713 [Mortierella sp. GBAus27b]